jgi:hypothetical protein
MATSGTYAYNPSLGELTLYAFNLAGIRNTALAQEHMESSRMATNLMLSRWSNQGVNLWAVDLQTVVFGQAYATLSASGNGTTATVTYTTPNSSIYPVGSSITIAGVTPSGYNGTYTVTSSANGSVSYANSTTGAQTVAGTINTANGDPTTSYSVDSNTVMILDAYVTTTASSSQPIDRIIMPVSRTEYASYPNKEQVGFPTIFWFDRLISPTVTLWPIPDGTSSQSLSYYRVRQIQDSSYTGGQTVEIPYRWLEAFATGLAYRLATIWQPQAVQMLKPMADEAYAIAAAQDVENVSMYISPQISGYFR